MERHGEVAGLRLSPLRALRFTGGPDVTDQLCPPYDVVDPDGRARLLRRSDHNVVRLTLPPEGRPAAAATTLDRWVRDGVLALDPEPSLYVLEHVEGERLRRGVIGAAWLCGAEDGSVLPHEDVAPGLVADRLALLEATHADLEPVLLTVEGGTGPHLATLTEGPPAAFANSDGVRLRLWRVVDPADHAAVAQALRGRRALIADGHHRWTAALAHTRRVGRGPGPQDRCLAVVVDAATDPLDLGAIHRVVAGRTPGRLRELWSGAAQWAPTSAEPSGLAARLADGGPGTVAVTDGVRAWVGRRRPAGRHAATGHSTVRADLDAAWLHGTLLPAAGATEDDVTFHHVADDAARVARRRHGAAVLLAPVDLAVVRALAESGERMPRKTTSFSPKPPAGLVIRRHADG